jgi:hypothetical protein
VIALMPQTGQDAESLAAVAEALQARGARVEALSLGALSAFDTEAWARRHGLAARSIATTASDRVPFYQQRRLDKLLTIARHRRKVCRLVADAEALVVGVDGAFERVAIEALQRRGRPTFVVMNGPGTFRKLGRARLGAARAAQRLGLGEFGPGAIGQTFVTRYFVPGSYHRDAMLYAGTRRELVSATGLPRFAPLVETWRARVEGRAPRRVAEPSQRPPSVLYLGTALDWHSYQELSDRHFEQVEVLAELSCHTRGRLAITYRPHPRESERELARVRCLPGMTMMPTGAPLATVLPDFDLTLSAASTALFEGIAAGVPGAVLHLHHDLSSNATIAALRAHAIPVFERKAELERALQSWADDPRALSALLEHEDAALGYFLDPSTPSSAARICDEILRSVAAVEGR